MTQDKTLQIANEYLSKISKMNSSEIKGKLFNEVDWYMLCLVGKENDNKPILKILQTISDEYAKQSQRKAYPVIIDKDSNNKSAAADGNKGIIELYDDSTQKSPFTKRFVLSDLQLCHENKHFDDWTKLKFCKPPKILKREHTQILIRNMRKLAKVQKPHKDSILLKTNEKEMQTLIVARVIDDKMRNYILKYKIHEPNISKITSDYYAYLSPFELNARLSEFSVINNALEQINNIQDINNKNKALIILQEETWSKHTDWLEKIGFNENHNKNSTTKSNTHIDNYFEMCKLLIEKNFKNNSEKLFEDYKQTIISQLNQLSNELRKLEEQIQDMMDNIEDSRATIRSQYPQITKDAIKTLYNTNMYMIAKPKNLLQIKEALKEINNNFNLPLLKCIQPTSDNGYNTLAYIAKKLEELHKAIKETPEYQLSTNDKTELQKLSKELAINILNSEQEILLIASGAYEKIKSISEMEIDEKTQEKQEVQHGRLLEIYNQLKKEYTEKEMLQPKVPNQPRVVTKQKDDDLEL